MCTTVDHKQTQHVQDDEAVYTFWKELLTKCGLGVKQVQRSAVASQITTYDIGDIFVCWCTLGLHPMSAVNVLSLLRSLSLKPELVTLSLIRALAITHPLLSLTPSCA